MSTAAASVLEPAYDRNARILNFLTGKAQTAIHELILALPLDANADIRTRLLYDETRHNLITALRSCQVLYGITAPPIRPMSPCPCGCEVEGATAPTLPRSGGAGTHSE